MSLCGWILGDELQGRGHLPQRDLPRASVRGKELGTRRPLRQLNLVANHGSTVGPWERVDALGVGELVVCFVRADLNAAGRLECCSCDCICHGACVIFMKADGSAAGRLECCSCDCIKHGTCVSFVRADWRAAGRLE